MKTVTNLVVLLMSMCALQAQSTELIFDPATVPQPGRLLRFSLRQPPGTQSITVYDFTEDSVKRREIRLTEERKLFTGTLITDSASVLLLFLLKAAPPENRAVLKYVPLYGPDHKPVSGYYNVFSILCRSFEEFPLNADGEFPRLLFPAKGGRSDH